MDIFYLLFISIIMKLFFFESLNSNHNRNSINNEDADIESLKTWVFNETSNEFNNWIRTLINCFIDRLEFDDEICLICVPFFRQNVKF